MATALPGDDVPNEENASYRILNLIAKVENIRRSDVASSQGDIVAFVGLTKSGKSTLINCLMGSPLISRKDPVTEDTFIEQDVGANGPKIGVGGESETDDPQNYGSLPGSNLVMWDFPGFGDNKGTDQEILNAVSYQKMLRAQNSVRFVVVASYALIKGDNPLPFFELLHQLLHICPDIAQSLCVVASKGEKGSVKGLLEKALSLQFPHADDDRRELVYKSQQLIRKLLQNRACIDFRAPNMDDDVSTMRYEMPNKQELVDCIVKLRGVKVGDIPLIISHEAKCDISGYYEVLYNAIKKKIDELCEALNKYMDSKGINVLDGTPVDRLNIYRSGKSEVEAILAKSTDFETFFEAVKDLGIGGSSVFAEHVARFRFIEELQYFYKVTDEAPRGVDEFFDTVRLCLSNGASQFSSLIAHSEACSNEEKRREEEWQKRHEAEVDALMEELRKTSEANSRNIAAAASVRPSGGIFAVIGETIEKMLDVVIEVVLDKVVDAIRIPGVPRRRSLRDPGHGTPRF